MRTRTISTIAGIALAVFYAETRAQEAQVLEPIVVSATRSQLPVINTPTGITVITDDQIKKSGASNLSDLLRGYGGIQISDLFGDGSRPTVSMRGFGGNAQNNALILVDGRRLNNNDLGTLDLNSVVMSDIERVEIVQGSAATLYGDQAVGGVINIITRTPEKRRASLRGAKGSDEYSSAELNYEDRFDSGVGVRFSAVARHSDNYRYRNDQEFHSVSGKARLDRDWGNAFFEYQDLSEDLETPGGLYFDQIAANRRQALNPGDFIDTSTQNARLGGQYRLPWSWRFEAEFTNRFSDGEGIQSVGGVPNALQTKRHHREFTPRLVREWQNNHGTALVTLGADVFWTDYHLVSDIGVTDDEQSQYAGYVRLVYPLTSRLTLTTGHREARVNNDLFASNVFQGVVLPAGSTVNDTADASEFGLSVDLLEHWRAYGRVETNYRFVNADEYGSAAGGFVPSTPVTQTGRSAEIGSSWQSNRLSLQAGVYRLDLENEIDFDPVQFINTNIGDTRRVGVFVDGAWSPLESLTLSAHYGFVDATIVSGPSSGLNVPFVADHSFLLGADYHPLAGANLHVEAVGITDRSAIGDFNETLSGAPGYVISNANLSYQWRWLEAGFRVGNLLNKKYVDNAQIGFRAPFFNPEVVRSPAPERTFLFTLNLHYD
ncbi:MAG: TonB-dependent receptor [Gammaproteobacteria bacterium]